MNKQAYFKMMGMRKIAANPVDLSQLYTNMYNSAHSKQLLGSWEQIWEWIKSLFGNTAAQNRLKLHDAAVKTRDAFQDQWKTYAKPLYEGIKNPAQRALMMKKLQDQRDAMLNSTRRINEKIMPTIKSIFPDFKGDSNALQRRLYDIRDNKYLGTQKPLTPIPGATPAQVKKVDDVGHTYAYGTVPAFGNQTYGGGTATV